MSDKTSQTNAVSERKRALLLLGIMPLFFSSNIIFGRAAVTEVEPFTLALIRWSCTAMILYPFVHHTLRLQANLIRSLRGPLLAMGFLGMWVCGALVYVALKYTSATNGVLIYTSSPVMIILMEWTFRGRELRLREAIGVFAALLGVVVIVSKGDFTHLTGLQFNIGDLLFVVSAVSWALYSVGLKAQRFQSLHSLPLFMLIAAAGALLVSPFALVEIFWLKTFPITVSAWGNIAGIVLIASLLAFSMFQYGVKTVGASLTGIFMYLLPVYGVTLAAVFLNESLAPYHAYGIVLILCGVILATLPTKFQRS